MNTLILVKTCRIIYDTENKAYVHKLEHDVPDIEKCQIFSTIMEENEDGSKSKNKNLFSTRIEYIGKKSPAIVIHKIKSEDKHYFNKDKSKDKHYLKISYIIIGYGFRSKLGLDVKFIGEEKQ